MAISFYFVPNSMNNEDEQSSNYGFTGLELLQGYNEIKIEEVGLLKILFNYDNFFCYLANGLCMLCYTFF